MKRDKNLETLSWEHHDGLVLAFRLEKGIKNNVDINIISDYLQHNWDQGLSHHFWQEERSLKAPLRKKIMQVLKMCVLGILISLVLVCPINLFLRLKEV